MSIGFRKILQKNFRHPLPGGSKDRDDLLLRIPSGLTLSDFPAYGSLFPAPLKRELRKRIPDWRTGLLEKPTNL
jgi:hypothetical protein